MNLPEWPVPPNDRGEPSKSGVGYYEALAVAALES